MQTEDGLASKLANAFSKGQDPGLLFLAGLETRNALAPDVAYWRDFAGRYLTEICHTPETVTVIDPIEPPPAPELDFLVLSVPPMPGAEYVSRTTLSSLWQSLDSWVRGQIEESGRRLSSFLNEHAPRFRQVGRVCFHLAENRNNANRPFAFMATYVSGLKADGSPKFMPLGRALEKYAGARNRKALLRLLSPVSAASKKSALVEELERSGDVYRPVAWTSETAYRFLRETPLLEESGLLVRLPDWWKKRPRARVSVEIETRRKSLVGLDAILDFRVDVAVGDERLGKREIRKILESGTGLYFLKGRWVEVDPEKLQQALAQWEKISAEVGEDGLSFVEGMRLLAGMSSPPDAGEDVSLRDWSRVGTGRNLSAILDGLRAPDQVSSPQVGRDLHARLRPYQQIGLGWLHFVTRLGLGACLADDMGLGKTIQVISLLLAFRREKNKEKPSLIVLPASLLSNWKAEITKFAPSLKIRFVHLSEEPKAAMDEMKASVQRNAKKALAGIDAVLTTYGMLTRQSWLLDVSWRLAVLDEAQAIRNPTTRQSRAARRIDADGRIALTGTPIENRLTDLWSLFDFLNPGLLGSHNRFKKYVKTLDTEAAPGRRYAPLRNLVSPYILRRMKTDKRIIADLPEKTEMSVSCGLTKKQATLYERLNRSLQETIENTQGMQRRGLVLNHLMRLKQLCNHPCQLTGEGDYPPSDSGKFKRLRDVSDVISSRGEKVLVFSQFREITEPLENLLTGVFGRPGLVLHGGTRVKDRRAMVDAFQRDGGPPFFVLSLKAGGTGLNLTAASHVVLFDRWWNPAVESQAMDRAFRIGQKKNVMVHKFFCQGTVEEKIVALLEEKSALASNLLDSGVEKLLTEMNDEELIRFISLDLSRAGI